MELGKRLDLCYSDGGVVFGGGGGVVFGGSGGVMLGGGGGVMFGWVWRCDV